MPKKLMKSCYSKENMKVRYKRYTARNVAIKLNITLLYAESLKVPDRLGESYRGVQ